MGSSETGRYLYWSERRVAEIAADNGIRLADRLSWTIKAAPQGIGAELASKDTEKLSRRDRARRIEKAIGVQAVSLFSSPHPARFAKGVGRVEIARFIGGPARDKGALFHVRTTSSRGQRVDLVLFGSMDNFPGRLLSPSDAPEDGWYSSAWHAIAELVESGGTRATSQWDDPESLSVEVLNLALHQGSTGTEEEHQGRPWTRGYTLGHADDSEWFAQIYTDVALTDGRWNLRGEMSDAQRILVGAPVWLRTASQASIVRYAEMRHRAATPRRRRLPFMR